MAIAKVLRSLTGVPGDRGQEDPKAVELFFREAVTAAYMRQRFASSRDLIEEAVHRLDTVTFEDRHVEANDQRVCCLG